MATLNQLESLKKALSFDRSPLCSGAISPSPGVLHLYYGKKNPRFIDFASATSEDLDLLLAACDPATFGRGNEDIYDESYRKAFKMDASDFIVHPNITGSDLMRIIEHQLLQSGTENKCIRAELYKLNVYDKDSFFKAHKDTPRGTDMFGSLVVIYPTPHEGGELVLRHKDREWKIDAKDLTASQSSPSLAYVAFYSDIEHEVLKVTSGRRVTVTYNLYLVDTSLEPQAPVVTTNAQSVSAFKTTLQALLKSPEFLPNGGILGFGLAHLYPFTSDTDLNEMEECLKGEDWHVYQACQELWLWPSLQMIYDEDRSGSEYGLMMDRIIKGPNYDSEYSSYKSALLRNLGGVSVNKTESTGLRLTRSSTWIHDRDMDGEVITWVSPFNDRNQLQDTSMAYGNEDTVGYLYCSPCLIARIRDTSNRV